MTVLFACLCAAGKLFAELLLAVALLVTTQNLGMQSALKMLLSRVLIIHDFLVAVKKGLSDRERF